MRQMTWTGLLLLAAACTGEQGVTQNVEGDEAEECRDGADNDQDGYFDCDDQGCWGSPDCGGAADDTGRPQGDDSGGGGDDSGSGGDDTGSGGDDSGSGGDDSGSGGDDSGGDDSGADDSGASGDSGASEEDCTGGSEPAVFDAYSSVQITYVVTVDVADGFESWEPDCTMTFSGEATLDSLHGVYAAGSGTYTRVSSTCSAQLAAAWWYPPDGNAFHTLEFSSDGTAISSWVTHATEEDCAPEGAADKMWTSEMTATISGSGVAVWSEDGTLESSTFGEMGHMYHDFTFQLTE